MIWKKLDLMINKSALLISAMVFHAANAQDIPLPQALEITIIRDDSVVVSKGRQRILEYVFGNVPFKPYVRYLSTPYGINVLRDQPSDHPHHHGLMLGFEVDGVNFWEEGPSSGHQLHRGIKPHTNGFIETIDWIGPNQKEVLLMEERRINVEASHDSVTFVSWESTLTLAPGKSRITLSGSEYHGLGMRFVSSLDRIGTFVCASADLNDSVPIKRDGKVPLQASWCSYMGEVNSKPVTVAMLDHPGNIRSVTWFTMSHPFAYLSATLNLNESPLVITEDHPATFRYAVALWDARVEPGSLKRIYQKWVSQ